jgi:hypothetical protein
MIEFWKSCCIHGVKSPSIGMAQRAEGLAHGAERMAHGAWRVEFGQSARSLAHGVKKLKAESSKQMVLVRYIHQVPI